MWKLRSVIDSADGWLDGLTVVAGDDAPLSLPLLIDRYGETLLGKRNLLRYGDSFPLRIRVTDDGKEDFVEIENIFPDGLPVTTNILDTDYGVIRDYTEFDTFSLIVCKSGNASVTCNGQTEEIGRGDILLIPASARGIRIEPHKKASLVESYIR